MQHTDQLLNVYHKWKENPKNNSPEILETADRLITHFTSRYSYRPMEFGYEDAADLRQELRLAFFRAFGKVEDPTNKRLYNYTKLCVEGRLKDLQRNYCRKQDRKKAAKFTAEVEEQVHDVLPDFGNPQTNNVARMLADGFSRKEILETLNLKPKEFDKIKTSLQEIYKP